MHAPHRPHLRQRPLLTLEQPVVVRLDARIVPQAGDRRQEDDLAQPRATAARHRLHAPNREPRVASRRVRPGQLHELPAVPVLVDGSDVGEDAGDARLTEAGDGAEVARLLGALDEAFDLAADRVHLRRELIDASDEPL
jgi:hypothetical protein